MRHGRRPPLAIALLLCLAVAAPVSAQPPDPLPLALAPEGRLPLEGTAWRLTDYVWRGVEREPGPEVAAWIQLQGGRVAGSGGCTKLRGAYAVTGSALAIDLGKVKKPACAEQTTVVQLALVEGLAAAAAFELEAAEDGGTELVITDADGVDRLRFGRDDAATLEGNQWLLEAFEVDGVRTDAIGQQPAVLAFQAARDRAARRRSTGELVGSTGCNGVLAPYTRQADVISFGALQPTDAPCTGLAASQEQAILAVLDATALVVDLPPDRLVLTSVDDGARLELVSSTPLEGTTWSLEKLGKADLPVEPVTLRLDGGMVSGTTPCGSYSAGYVTDGVFITIADVTGSGAADCPGAGLDRRLARALRATVRADRSAGDLRLEDASGKLMARFTTPGPL